MIITVAALIAGVAAVIGVASIVFGMATSHSGVSSVAPSTATLSVQAPATATAPLSDALPAASPSGTTTWAGATGETTTTATTPPVAATPPKPAATAPTPDATGLGVVVIDAGHQKTGNSSLEPEGPGSSVKKPKVESGASGVATHVDESVRNLQVALVLQKVLEARGVKVVMVRTTQDVNIPNSQRAAIANNAHAALFIRLHCDSAGSSVSGVLTEEPAKSWYSGYPIVAKSAVAAKLVQDATVAATGAHDRGIRSVDNLSGFNYSKVPSVLVEMGLMSNPTEDRLLATPAYQQKLANGMANGIVAFLKQK